MRRPNLKQRESAQVIALFAIGLVAMLAMVGVALDGGTLYLQRRTAQNAADAAALAGTRALQQTPGPSTLQISAEICKYALANQFGVTPTVSAYFVNTSGSSLGTITLPTNCSGSTSNAIPTGSSGVHVDIQVGPYNTYLVGIVGVRQLQAQAAATAQVGLLAIPNPDITPLAGCGPDMLTRGNSATPFVNLMLTDNVNINPALYYPTATTDLVLQGSQMSQQENATCPKWNGTASAWKGQIDPSGIPGAFVIPDGGLNVPVSTGNSNIDSIISSLCVSLYGSDADPTNTGASASKCYLLVPIATPPNPTDNAHIVTLACFKIYDGGNGQEKWRGILYPPNACTYGVYLPTWTFGNLNNETRVLLTT
jgi:hypothetical protein